MSSQYFPSPKDSGSIDINLNLNGYAAKDDFKNLDVDTSSFALKTNLTSIKTKVDAIDSSKNTFEAAISKLVDVTFLIALAFLLLS